MGSATFDSLPCAPLGQDQLSSTLQKNAACFPKAFSQAAADATRNDDSFWQALCAAGISGVFHQHAETSICSGASASSHLPLCQESELAASKLAAQRNIPLNAHTVPSYRL